MTDKETMRQRIELKPCPFCGADEAYIGHAKDEAGATLWFCECDACSCGTDAFGSEGDAIVAWNRRPEHFAPVPVERSRKGRTMTEERTQEILAAIRRGGIEGLIEANVSDEELIQAFDAGRVWRVKCYCGKCPGFFWARTGIDYGDEDGHTVVFTLPILSAHPEGRPEHRNGLYHRVVED